MALDGLSTLEAQRIVRETGPNAIPARRQPWWRRLAGKFWAPVPWMLEVTAVLELALGKWADAALVAAVLVLNAAIGFVQEGRARSALELLRSRLEVDARVLRDGRWVLLPATGIVPGDVVHVRVGDFVPADLDILEGDVLADQSGLTGESIPVERSTGSMLYSGTVIVRGEVTGRVTATGVRTYFGRTAELVGASAPEEHLGALVLRMVRAFIALDLVLAASGTGYLIVTGSDLQDIVSFAVVLLLASIPVALPAAFSLAGALGARRLAEVGVLTTRLPVLQDAASMEVLCVDKTGTLTRNRLSVERVVPLAAASADDVLALAAAASDAATQDPIDLAILEQSPPRGDWTRSAFVPFDPATKRSEATLTTPRETLRVTKGSPAVLARLTGAEDREEVTELAATGARVLSIAVASEAGAWEHMGLVSLADSVRDEAQPMLRRLGELGVRVMMVTGDSIQTAAAVAAQLGMVGAVIAADDLATENIDLGRVAVVAQVLPEDKHALVRRLQTAGQIVGMTGDGVNDAPALRQAEVGIAVEGATDVAKAAAGAVLTRGGLTDIVALVEESRRIHQRSLTYALNVSVKKIEVPVLLALGVFAWREFVFTPLLMALLLLANDVVSMAITTDRATASGRPNTWRVGRVIAGALVVAFPMLIVSAGILGVARGALHLPLNEVRTIIFVTLVVSSQATIYIVRTGARLWRSRPSGTLIAVTALDLVGAGMLALRGWLMPPVPALTLIAVTLTLLLGATAADALKALTFRQLGLHAP